MSQIEPDRAATLGVGGSPFLSAQLALLGLLALDVSGAPQTCLHTVLFADEHAYAGALVSDVVDCENVVLADDFSSLTVDLAEDETTLTVAAIADQTALSALALPDEHDVSAIIPEDC